MPGFSIIIPFKTGKAYLRECLHSALLQTHEDFEIIILADNTSNQDGALDAVLALKDTRIRIESATGNLNILENWGRIKDLPKKEYMTILGYDDVLSKDFLKIISAMIQEDPEASLYHTHFNYIDAAGNAIKPCLPLPERLSADVYLALSLEEKISVMATGYVFRSKDYDRLGGIPTNYPNLIYADLQLWIELASISYLKVSPQFAFSFRIHASVTKTSKNRIILDAFLVYLKYLKHLQNTSPSFETALKTWGQEFVNNSTRALVHRLLKTEKKYRDQLSIQEIFQSLEPVVLDLGLTFLPKQIKGVQPAIWIDRYDLIHQLFMGFQQLKRQPI
jgi:glycosyltransferase involved in cell wall biosynthesis